MFKSLRWKTLLNLTSTALLTSVSTLVTAKIERVNTTSTPQNQKAQYLANTKAKDAITINAATTNKIIAVPTSNTGSDMSGTSITKVFDPFFTTKDVGKGTGQGLAIAHNVIVNKHHGSIKA